MPSNVQDICRLCLSKEGLMFPIFQRFSSKNETAFRFKIMSCTSIEIYADDDLPAKVCYVCVHKVEKFFQFQEMCGNSDAVLRAQIKENSVRNKADPDLKSEDNKTDWSEKHYFLENDKSYLISDLYQSSECFPEEKIDNFDDCTCFVCSSNFLSSESLIEHLSKKHVNINSYFCKKCKITFSQIHQYKNHLTLRHGLACNCCDSVFKFQKSLEEHLKLHSIENFICKFCKKKIGSLGELKNHELVHLQMTCKYCLKELDTLETCCSHEKNCIKKYFCKFCEESFDQKKNLIEHVNDCHDLCFPYKCKTCLKPFRNSEEELQHHCLGCPNNFKCKNCAATFSDASVLKNHIATEHERDVLICRFCSKKFSLKSSLRRHEKSHSGVKPYQCKFCPRKFKDSRTCVVHTRTHTGEHPFQCQECHKYFKQLGNLKMHTYRHHKKNQMFLEEGTAAEIKHQEYKPLYSGKIVDNYSGENVKVYQGTAEDNLNDGFN